MSRVSRIAAGLAFNFIYDFFMGASLNPRIGSLDIKMLYETRIAWYHGPRDGPFHDHKSWFLFTH